MAKVTIKGIPQARDNALKFLKNTVKDKKFLDEMGQLTADQIRRRTKDRREEYKQKDLKDLTVEVRSVLAEVNDTNEFFRKGKSNLTFTGQLLDSIMHKVDVATGFISIFLKDKRITNNALSRTEARERYYQYLDIDHNSGNALKSTFDIKTRQEIRTNKDFRLKIKALFIASYKQPEKGNNEIKNDLEAKGFRFFFISTKLNTLLTSKIAEQLRRKLSLYKKIVRKLS